MNCFRRKLLGLFTFAVLNLMAFAALAKSHPLLVDPSWLKKNISNKGILVIDVRRPSDYNANHIPTAIHLDAELTFGQGQKSHRIAPPTVIKTLLSQRGVKHSDHIVVYDNGNFLNAAQVFWVLETYGHAKVSILNGGFPLWTHFQFPVTQTPGARPPSQYLPVLNYRSISTKLDTRLAMNTRGEVIIDARNREHYLGHKTQAKRSGHIPTAVSIPWRLNLQTVNQQRTLKPIGQLSLLYSDISKRNKLVTYCNRGKESALSYFVLRLLGYQVSVYDGAWIEWGNDSKLPIEK